MCAKYGANRPSRLVAFPEFVLRLVRLFAALRAQKHAKKQHLYVKNYNSGPNMQTSTSLTFFTAIFVAFSGALAEELMIFCRHVRTELYRLQGYLSTVMITMYQIKCKILLLYIPEVNAHLEAIRLAKN